MTNPAIAELDCGTCQKWLIDLDTGKPKLRRGKPQPRKTPPACKLCPKQSPSEAHKFELAPSNSALVEFYLRHRATAWRALTTEQLEDDYLQRLLSVVDLVIRQTELEAANVRTAHLENAAGP